MWWWRFCQLNLMIFEPIYEFRRASRPIKCNICSNFDSWFRDELERTVPNNFQLFQLVRAVKEEFTPIASKTFQLKHPKPNYVFKQWHQIGRTGLKHQQTFIVWCIFICIHGTLHTQFYACFRAKFNNNRNKNYIHEAPQ